MLLIKYSFLKLKASRFTKLSSKTHSKVDVTQFSYNKQENNRTVRLCPRLWKTIIVDVHFAHANLWLFIIPITKPFLDFVHLLLKCGSRTNIHINKLDQKEHETSKCKRKVVRKFALETEKLMDRLCLQTKPTNSICKVYWFLSNSVCYYSELHSEIMPYWVVQYLLTKFNQLFGHNRT